MSCHPPARQVGPFRPEDGLTTGEQERSPYADLHVKLYANRHVKVYADMRHRQRARGEDRIRAAQALTCWTQALLLAGPLARAEPKTLRYRLLHVTARIVCHARRLILRLQASWPW